MKPPAGSMSSGVRRRAPAMFCEFSDQPGLLTTVLPAVQYGAIDVKSFARSAPIFSWICALNGRM